MKWKARESTAELEYDLSGYLERVNQYLTAPLSVAQLDFGITAYNARDFGFRYIFLSASESENVTNPKVPSNPVRNTDYVGLQANACGGRESCNHRGPVMAPFDTIQVPALPAKATFFLWHEIPEDLTQPEFRYVVLLR